MHCNPPRKCHSTTHLSKGRRSRLQRPAASLWYPEPHRRCATDTLTGGLTRGAATGAVAGIAAATLAGGDAGTAGAAEAAASLPTLVSAASLTVALTADRSTPWIALLKARKPKESGNRWQHQLRRFLGL